MREWRCASERLKALGMVLMGVMVMAGNDRALAGGETVTRSPAAAIAAVLDSLHDAAAKADEERYFAQFATDAVFFGTDPDERWSVDEFRAYAHPHFARGSGWTYEVPAQGRQVHVTPDGLIAWFDEILDNAKYGRCRGTGVLRREADGWRIVQYNLSIPIPNAVAGEVVERIKQAAAER